MSTLTFHPHCPTIDRAAMLQLLETAEQSRLRLRQTPLVRIVEVLSRAGTAWANPASAVRMEAMAHLPGILRFSPEMVATGLDCVAAMLRPEALWARISREVRWPEAMHGWARPTPDDPTWFKAEPLGIVLHVASGNVFIASAVTLIEGLLTRNVNVLKAASADRVFPELFCRSLREADVDLVLEGAFQAVHWAGGTDDIESLCKQKCQGILVWGGQTAIRQYADNLPPTTRMIPYGPRLSLAAISAASMAADLAQVATRMAADVVLWDQQSCASPQVVYVEDEARPGDNARRLLEALAPALAQAGNNHPAGPLEPDEMAELTKVREIARMDAAMGEAVLRTPGRDLDWTLLYQADPRFRLSCLFRTLLVKSVPRLEDMVQYLMPVRGYLQTVTLAAPPGRRRHLADLLADIGATRIVPLGQSADIRPGDPHDGQLALERLVRWATYREEAQVDR